MGKASSFKIGVDIGGTFTDVTIINAEGRITTHKTPSTPRAPAEAVLRGLREAMAKADCDPANCASFVHGSTIGVNTIIQRTGARVGMIVTKGFEDLLEIGRTKMPDPFSLFTMRPIPLARKDNVRGVLERVDGQGRVITPLDEAGLVAAAAELVVQGIDVLVVVFMNAYRNASHEQRAVECIRQKFAGLSVVSSSEIWPQVREYERATVSAMNGYIAPKVTDYLKQLQAQKEQVGLTCPFYMTSSNGGILPIAHASTRPISTLLSGPASGVVGTLHMMRSSNIKRAVTLDIGGTSADLCVLDGDEIPYAWDHEIDGLPVTLPSVDVSSIGAGGSSIASADNMGLLRVGPQSAGSEPGPVAYGRGGTQPTLTDAYLFAGFIDPDNFVGGELKLNLAAAKGAIADLAAKLKLNPRDTAAGVIQVATSNLVAEFTRLAAKKGIDSREFTLIPFGGAGATHACLLADEVHVQHIAVPYSPGNLCATGSVLADFRLDFVKSVYSPLAKLDQAMVDDWVREVEAQARQTLDVARQQIETIRVVRSAAVRYAGQGYEVPVVHEKLADLPALFRAEYARLYGPRSDSADLEVISVSATVVGVVRKVEAAWGGGKLKTEPTSRRRVDFGTEEVECPVFTRAHMAPGWRGTGPFVVDQPDTTIVVTAGWNAEVDSVGTLHLRKV